MSAAFDDPRVGAAFSDVKGLSSVAGDEPPPLPPGPPPAVTWAYLNGAGMALRRHAAIEVGGFDERLGPGAPLHGEEPDLALPPYEPGWQGVGADPPVVGHLDWRDDSERPAHPPVAHRGAGAF